jgi:hypothetical protein
VSSNEFNIFAWSDTIPFCNDDIWLGMQVRNIALVDVTYLRPLEHDALSAYMERERTPGDILLPLSALSQMWIFSLYEFLRTWRQRADFILKLAREFDHTRTENREAFVNDAAKKLDAKKRMLQIGPEMHATHLAQFTDGEFVKEVQAYRNRTDDLFREAEALRVTLAKHEVPKTSGLLAEAPGYGRMNYRDGSMYWFVTLKDETQIKVDRRELGNAFLGIDDDPI